MSDNNQLNIGDVDSPAEKELNLKDLIHLFDVHKDRANIKELKSDLYDVDGDGDDSNPDREDVEHLYDILRGNESAEKLTSIEFRWTYINELKDSILQVRNILQPTDPGFSAIGDRFASVYYYRGDTPFSSFDLSHSNHPIVALGDGYSFDREITLEGGVNVVISKYQNEEFLRLFVNDMPIFLRVGDLQDTGESSFFDTNTWPVVKLSELKIFSSTWKTESDLETISLPLVSSGDYSFNVDWGDSSFSSITESGSSEITHTYESAGEYEVKINGKIKGWSFNDLGDKLKIINITSWGCLDFRVEDVSAQFYGCENLVSSATDAPFIDSTTNLQNCFRNCESLLDGVGKWNVSEVKIFSYMFAYATNFNGNITEWDTTSATKMDYMFTQCSSFNKDISTKQIKKDESEYTAWNVSNVTTLNRMFAGATSFDQNLGSWNVSSCENFGLMLQMVNLSDCNYTFLLFGWANLDLLNITDEDNKFQAGDCKYSLEATSARDYIENKIGITDSGASTESCVIYDHFVTIVNPSNTQPLNADSMDSRYWSTSDIKNVTYYDAFILPLATSLHSELINQLRNLEQNDKNEERFLEFKITSVGGGYNYGHRWKVVPLSAKLINFEEVTRIDSTEISQFDKKIKWSPTTGEISDWSVDDSFSICVPFDSNPNQYTGIKVAGVFKTEPTKLPISGDHLHIMEIESNGATKKSSIRVQSTDWDYTYIRTKALGGYDSTDNYSSTTSAGKIIYRNNEKCKLIVFFARHSNSSDLSTDSKLNDLMFSTKKNNLWTIPISLEVQDFDLRAKFGFDDDEEVILSFNDKTNKLLMLNQTGIMVVLEYDNESSSFSLFTNSPITQFSNMLNVENCLIDDNDNVILSTIDYGKLYLISYNKELGDYDPHNLLYMASDSNPSNISWLSRNHSKIYDIKNIYTRDEDGYMGKGIELTITEKDYLNGVVEQEKLSYNFNLNFSEILNRTYQAPYLQVADCNDFILMHTYEFYSFVPTNVDGNSSFDDRTTILICWDKQTKQFTTFQIPVSYIYSIDPIANHILTIELHESNISDATDWVNKLYIRIVEIVKNENEEITLKPIDLIKFSDIGFQYQNILSERMTKSDFEMAPVTYKFQDWTTFASDETSSPLSFVVT